MAWSPPRSSWPCRRAWLVTRTDLPGAASGRVAAALPLVIPSYVAAFCLLGVLRRAGPVCSRRSASSASPTSTGYPGRGRRPHARPRIPTSTSSPQAALRDLDPALEEAARGLGLSPTPSALCGSPSRPLRPAVALGSLLVALYVLSDFGVVSLMRYDSLTRAIYVQYRSLFDRTPAAVPPHWFSSPSPPSRLLPGTARPDARQAPGARARGPRGARRPIALGRLPLRRPRLVRARHRPSSSSCPLVSSSTGSSVGSKNERRLAIPWNEGLHSLTASGLAAGVAVARRASGRGAGAAVSVAPVARLLERLSYAGNALPGLVIALSLVFFAARYASPVYQTLALLVFAYAGEVLPTGSLGDRHRPSRASTRAWRMRRGDSDAARSQRPGSSRCRSSARDCSRARRSCSSSAMKELPATILLRPIGFDTLATEIWGIDAGRAYSQAAIPSLFLIASVGARPLAAPRREPEAGSAELPDRVPAMAGHGHSIDEYLESIYFLAFPIGDTAQRAERDRRPAWPRCSVSPGPRPANVEAARGRGPRRAGRAEGGHPHADRESSAPSASSASTGSSSGFSPTSWATPPRESHVHADELGDTFNDEMIERMYERLGRPDRCPHGWPVAPEVEQSENAGLVALAELEPGQHGEIVRLAEHDGDLLHWSTTRATCRARRSRCVRHSPPRVSSRSSSPTTSARSQRRPRRASTSASRPERRKSVHRLRRRSRRLQGFVPPQAGIKRRDPLLRIPASRSRI